MSKGYSLEREEANQLQFIPSGEPGVSGNFWGRIKGAKYRFALQDGTWDFPGDAVAGKGLIL